MPNVSANGISIYYERSGSGPPLLFINGSGTTLATTGMLVKPFTKRCDVVAYDQRGLGLTEIPPPPYTMAQYAADAAALIDVAGWDSCRVVGISFGGMVAQELAVTWPDRIERLALLCTSPGGPDTSSYPLHELDALPVDERTVKGLELLDTRFTPEYLADHPNDRGLADFLAAGYTAEKSDGQRAGEAAQMEARRGHDVRDRLERISCPTFVGAGRYDGIAPVKNGQAIVDRVPNSAIHIYDGGHAFFVQDPEAFPEIVDFLAG
jgi:pimeloyl-ACP methyl ester carboxylesterase